MVKLKNKSEYLGKFVENEQQLIENIIKFNKILEVPDELDKLKGSIVTTREWIYSKEIDMFAPKKYIKYKDLTVEEYNHAKNHERNYARHCVETVWYERIKDQEELIMKLKFLLEGMGCKLHKGSKVFALRKVLNTTSDITNKKSNLEKISGDEEDDNFQFEIEEALEPTPKEPDKPIKRQDKIDIKVKRWRRDPKVALRAIIDANNQCEIDITHESFTSQITGKRYVEAHHLIPIKKQDEFYYSLDIPANIVSLCPNCHRKLHYAIFKEKEDILMDIYFERRRRLIKCKIDIGISELFKHYGKN